MFLWAVAEQHLNRSEAASVLLKKVIALEPLNPDAHYLLARNLSKSGMTTEAIQEWRRVLELQPDHVEALYDLSHALSGTDPALGRENTRTDCSSWNSALG
jgi:cytochrome c-type biogenesis protein CcmH/NrfG